MRSDMKGKGGDKNRFDSFSCSMKELPFLGKNN